MQKAMRGINPVNLKKTFAHAWKETNRTFDEKFIEKNIAKGIENDIVLVEESNGKLNCFGWAKHSKDFFGNKFGKIKLLLVEPSLQEKGTGTKLLEKLEKELNEKDIRLDCLAKNPAIKLYKRKEFKEFLKTLRKIE